MKRALICALLILAGLFFYKVRGILPPFLMGAFLAYILEPPVLFLVKGGFPRQKGVLLVYFIAVLLFVLVLCLLPEVLKDAAQAAGEIPGALEIVQDNWTEAQIFVKKYGMPRGAERLMSDTLTSIGDYLNGLGQKIIPYALSSVTVLSYLVISPIISYYILRDMHLWRQKGLVILSKYPLPYLDLAHDIDRAIGGFVRGQALVSAGVMVLVSAAGMVLGLRHSVLLGVMAGLGEFVPIFGPALASVPFLLSAFLKSVGTGFWAAFVWIFIQWADSNLLVPNITGPRVGLNPLLVMFALLAGGKLFGFWGVLLAVPAAGVVKAFFKFGTALYRQSL